MANCENVLIQRLLKDGRRDPWASLVFKPNGPTWEARQEELAQMLNYAKKALKTMMVPHNQHARETEETGFDFDHPHSRCTYTVPVPDAKGDLEFQFEYQNAYYEISITIRGIGYWVYPTPKELEAIKAIAEESDTYTIAFKGTRAFALFVDRLVKYCGYNIPPETINPPYTAWVQEEHNPENKANDFIANPQGDA